MNLRQDTFTVGSGVRTSTMRDLLLGDTHKDVSEQDATHPKEEANTLVAEDGSVYELNSLGQAEWASKPTVKGQFQKDKAWKFGSHRADVFDLREEKQLELYNSLLEKASREDPAAAIIDTERKFFNGNFIIMVTWCPIMYRILMRKK